MYYIDSIIRYKYPSKTSRTTTDYGVLSDYIGVMYNRSDIDDIICELIKHHPYVDNSMSIEINIMWKKGNTDGYYHALNFINDEYRNQEKSNTLIKYAL